MAELLSAFHFSEPGWLWALLLCLPVALWLLLTRAFAGGNEHLQRMRTATCCRTCWGGRRHRKHTRWRRLCTLDALWALLVLAMAGPRWDFTDVQLFRPGTNLMVLFDISRSMNVADVQPHASGAGTPGTRGPAQPESWHPRRPDRVCLGCACGLAGDRGHEWHPPHAVGTRYQPGGTAGQPAARLHWNEPQS